MPIVVTATRAVDDASMTSVPVRTFEFIGYSEHYDYGYPDRVANYLEAA
jgi:hypothetical protein